MNIMKIGILVLFLTVSLSPAGCREAPHPISAAPLLSDQLIVNSDGTATVTGIVLENNHGCEVDAACYLRLQVKDKEVWVIYHPGEGEYRIANKEMLNRASRVKQGAHVEAYGKHNKRGTLDAIEIYSSDTYYVHVLTD